MERYKVTLTKEECDQLHAIIIKGVHSSQKFGSEKKNDSECVRNGVCEISIATEPLSGKELLK